MGNGEAMGMVVREDDLLVVNISVHSPEWLNDLSNDEFENVMAAAEDKAVKALVSKVYEAEQFWRARKMIHDLGQMSLEDYNV